MYDMRECVMCDTISSDLEHVIGGVWSVVLAGSQILYCTCIVAGGRRYKYKYLVTYSSTRNVAR